MDRAGAVSDQLSEGSRGLGSRAARPPHLDVANPGETCRDFDLAHPFGQHVAVPPRTGELVHLVGDDRGEHTVTGGDKDGGQAKVVGRALGPAQQAGLAHAARADVDADPTGETALERTPGQQTTDVSELHTSRPGTSRAVSPGVYGLGCTTSHPDPIRSDSSVKL